ncbi:MAG: mercuric reductase [Catalinimonas sp.]
MATSTNDQFDAIIIGAGQAGNPLAKAFASHEQHVAVVERHLVGGSCINYGCTPTKILIASAHAAHAVRRADDFGLAAGDLRVDMPRVRQRKDRLIEKFRESTLSSLEESEYIKLIRGEARFVDPHTLTVKLSDGGERHITAPKIFINTGSSPLLPPIDGLKEAEPLNSTTVMDLEEVPEHLVVLGGGYIGLSFGQMHHRFGARVTVVESSGEILSGLEDADVADGLKEILEEEGVAFKMNTRLTSARRLDNGELELTLEPAEGETQTIRASHLLVATGREPNTKALDLEKAGVTVDDEGYVEVNDHLATSTPGVWALGDVKGGPAFTHVAYDDFRIVRNHLFEDGTRGVDDRTLTYTVFTEPQLGRFGLTEEQAKEQGVSYRVAKMPMEYAARAVETGNPEGFMKILVDNEDKLIGAAILGLQGGEIAMLLKVAARGGLTYQTVQEMVLAHPTLAESLNNVFSFLEEATETA